MHGLPAQLPGERNERVETNMNLAWIQGEESTDTWTVLFLVGTGLALLVFLFVFLRYASLYIRSILTRANVGLFDMFAMSLRRVNPSIIVNARSCTKQ